MTDMTRNKALRILGMENPFSQEELKKKYRSLMLIVHPDVAGKQEYAFDASSINLAYEYLTRDVDNTMNDQNQGVYPQEDYNHDSQRRTNIRWGAPINAGAYIEREIYHEIEDADGAVIGTAVLDSGKYYWTEDEEFSLFLKSLYQCSKRIVREHDSRKHNEYDSREDDVELLSKIVYLLAQQFVDGEMVLELFATEIKSRSGQKSVSENSRNEYGPIYQIDAMLEIDGRYRFSGGEILYPAALRNHRLYVKNARGKELGYISFKDDRLYYGVIPLFERRSAQLKMNISGEASKRVNGKRYRDVCLYIRLKTEEQMALAESINQKLERLLDDVS